MTKELYLRIFTSLILVTLLILMINYSIILISTLILIFVFSWIEFNNIINRIHIRKNKLNLSKFLSKFLILIYLSFFTLVIIDEFIENRPNISWNLIFVICVCVLSDIGGYIFGKTFKGKKITKISPNKTYSGMFGSFFLSIIFALSYSFSLSFVDVSLIVFLSILISFICQLGDLFVSFLKRKAKLKDTGNILPGHGGILDRIDGIIFALPFGIILINFYY